MSTKDIDGLEELKKVVQTDIVANLSEEARQDILRQAVRAILSKGGQHSYGQSIERVVVDTAVKVATAVVTDLIENDEEFKEKIRETANRVLEAQVTAGVEKLLKEMPRLMFGMGY